MLLFMVFFLHSVISCKQSCSSLAQSGNNIIDKRQLLLIIYIYIYITNDYQLLSTSTVAQSNW